MSLYFLKKKKSNKAGKIVAITVAAVTGACAVAYFVYRLVLKLQSKRMDEENVCATCPLADECVDGSLCDESAEAEASEEETEEVEAAEEATEAPAAE